MPNLLLASSSKYRKQLLQRLQIPFEVYSPDVDESYLNNETHKQHVLRLSKLKAIEGSKAYPGCICIGSDTIASFNGEILGKPITHEKAIKQLTKLSGKKVNFVTGICVYEPKTKTTNQVAVNTIVTFKNLTLSNIENYLQKEKPYHSCGSFKSEGLGNALIEDFISDDPTAIMGLPLIKLSNMLIQAGIEII